MILRVFAIFFYIFYRVICRGRIVNLGRWLSIRKNKKSCQSLKNILKSSISLWAIVINLNLMKILTINILRNFLMTVWCAMDLMPLSQIFYGKKTNFWNKKKKLKDIFYLPLIKKQPKIYKAIIWVKNFKLQKINAILHIFTHKVLEA